VKDKRALRLSYGCDCADEEIIGRWDPDMSEGVRSAMRAATGSDAIGCPWRAFSDPLVQRVLSALPFFESGQLAFKLPAPSHRLVEAVGWYQTVSNRMTALEMDERKKERQSERTRADHLAQLSGRSGRG